MGEKANIVVVHEDGTHELHRTGWAVGIDLDLLDGPDALLGTLPELRRDDWWLDDDLAHGGVLLDLGRKTLLFFTWEGPSAELRHRAATLALIRAAWPGWTVRPLYDGPTELRTHLGLDPEHVRRRGTPLDPAPFLAPDDEELTGPDPGGILVTLDTGRCHVASAAFDHPAREGPALLDRLADAPDHGTCRLHVESGVHLDPERRRLDWWSLPATPQAYEVPRLWPGWTVRFHRDDWQQHARRAPARFAPAPFDPGAPAVAAVLAEAEDRRARRVRHRALVARLHPGR
ncbi:hypothetical protein ACFY00_21550 [Kitasatospora sp. NPDC001540]|uniref:hypothetical protein n=1 Tax=Kitasatospora sp. NPDC001540 TaxID=3364014 RepID=UPI003696614A